MRACKLCTDDQDMNVSISCENCHEYNYFGSNLHIVQKGKNIFKESFDHKGIPSINKKTSCTSCGGSDFSIEYESKYCIVCDYLTEKMKAL